MKKFLSSIKLNIETNYKGYIAMILFLLILPIAAINTIFNQSAREYRSIMGMLGGVASTGTGTFYSVRCTNAIDCEEYITTLREISTRTSDPLVSRFVETIDQTQMLYLEGKFNNWQFIADFNISFINDDYNLNLVRLSVESYTEGNLNSSLSSDFDYRIPYFIKNPIEQIVRQSDDFNIRMVTIEASRIDEPIHQNNSFARNLRIISEEISIVSARLILLILSSAIAIYGITMLFLGGSIKNKKGKMRFNYGTTAISISIPVLIALSAV